MRTRRPRCQRVSFRALLHFLRMKPAGAVCLQLVKVKVFWSQSDDEEFLRKEYKPNKRMLHKPLARKPRVQTVLLLSSVCHTLFG